MAAAAAAGRRARPADGSLAHPRWRGGHRRCRLLRPDLPAGAADRHHRSHRRHRRAADGAAGRSRSAPSCWRRASGRASPRCAWGGSWPAASPQASRSSSPSMCPPPPRVSAFSGPAAARPPSASGAWRCCAPSAITICCFASATTPLAGRAGCSAPSSCGAATACSSPSGGRSCSRPPRCARSTTASPARPFNAQPAPFKAGRLGDLAFDADHGGTEVGGRIKGLDIVVLAHGRVGRRQRRGGLHRVDLRVPQHLVHRPRGAAADRAAAGRRGVARHAVGERRGAARAPTAGAARCARPTSASPCMQRRDPLLVTTRGADRVLAQAFPVGRNGGTIKFKIGITAPLELIEGGDKARLTLPAVFDRNFSFPKDVGHSVWIEGKQPLAATANGLTATRIDGGLFRLAGMLGDADLARLRPTITVERDRGHRSASLAQIGEGEAVVQEVVSAPPKPGALMLVVDGSARMRTAAKELAAALRALPPTARVGLIIATEPMQRIALAPASDAHKEAHGPAAGATSPTSADRTTARRWPRRCWRWKPSRTPGCCGCTGRSRSPSAAAPPGSSRRPSVWRACRRSSSTPSSRARTSCCPTGRGPGARACCRGPPRPRPISPASSRASSAMRRRRCCGAHPSQSGAKAAEGTPKGSDHIARLWAKDAHRALMRDNGGTTRADAVALAVQYRLVTPVSGVVVLETKQQYDESRLTPVSQATVPTIPEPHEWALMLIACLALRLAGVALPPAAARGGLMHPLYVTGLVVGGDLGRVALVSRARRRRPRGGGGARADGGVPRRRSAWPARPRAGRGAAAAAPADRRLARRLRRDATRCCRRSSARRSPSRPRSIASTSRVLKERPPLAFWGLVALSLPVLPSLQFVLGYPMRIVSATLTVGLLQPAGPRDRAAGHVPGLARRDGAVRRALQRRQHAVGRAAADAAGLRAAAAADALGCSSRSRAHARPRHRRQRAAGRQPVLRRGRAHRRRPGLVARRHRPRGLRAVGGRDPVAAGSACTPERREAVTP